MVLLKDSYIDHWTSIVSGKNKDGTNIPNVEKWGHWFPGTAAYPSGKLNDLYCTPFVRIYLKCCINLNLKPKVIKLLEEILGKVFMKLQYRNNSLGWIRK